MRQEKYGVLMVNLGTPEAPTLKAVKLYLAEFLSDRRVVDTPRALWLPLLYGVILPLRSPRVAKLYQSVWMEEGSPLLVYSRRQQQALAASLPDVVVELAMSYGQPALPQARLLAQDITRLIHPAAVSAVFLLHQRRDLGCGGAQPDGLPMLTVHKLHSRLRGASGVYCRAERQRLPGTADRIAWCSLSTVYRSATPKRETIIRSGAMSRARPWPRRWIIRPNRC